MRMRGKKPLFNYRDTWNMDKTLDVLIHAALVKFKWTITESKVKDWAGIPSSFLAHKGVSLAAEYDHEEMFNEWLDCLDKMIYAFNPASEPNLKDYDFTYKMVDVTSEEERGLRQAKFVCSHDIESERYDKDMEEYRKKRDEGRQLFIACYDGLWI